MVNIAKETAYYNNTLSLEDLSQLAAVIIKDAAECVFFCEQLEVSVKDPFDKELIGNIRLNKIKLLRHTEELVLTGKPPEEKKPGFMPALSLKPALKEKMFKELENAGFFRTASRWVNDESLKELVLSAAEDSHIHAHWLFYLYDKY